jgi:hypothetical protein
MWAYIFLDLVLCLTIYPLVFSALLPLLIYRLWVRALARLLHPDLIPISTNDQFMAWDLFTSRKETKPLVYSVGCSVRIQGRISLEGLKEKLSAKILNSLNENGEKSYPELFEHCVLFGGYTFRKPVEKMNIDSHVKEVRFQEKGLNEFRTEWIGRDYAEGTSPWEAIIIPLLDDSETILLFKIHHALADAYSLLHIFNKLMDNQVPPTPREPEDTFWQKVSWELNTTIWSYVIRTDHSDKPNLSLN